MLDPMYPYGSFRIYGPNVLIIIYLTAHLIIFYIQTFCL
jgi:hypothetical protein